MSRPTTTKSSLHSERPVNNKLCLLPKVLVAILADLWYVFVLQGGERMKYELLKAIYDCFYIPSELSAATQEDISIDSFISGFELAWKLSAELNHYENERSVSRRMALGPDARFTCKKEEE